MATRKRKRDDNTEESEQRYQRFKAEREESTRRVVSNIHRDALHAYKARFSPDNIERLVRIIDNGPTDEEIMSAVIVLRRLLAKVDAEAELEAGKDAFNRLGL